MCTSAGPLGPVHERDRRDELAHRVGDLPHAHLFFADEVEDAVGRGWEQAGDDTVGEILDVDELPRLPAVAGDRQCLAALRAQDEGGNDRRGARARAVRDAEAQDRVLAAVELVVRPAVHLAGDLRRRIEV